MLTEDHFESGKKRDAAITWHTLALEFVHFDSKTMIFFKVNSSRGIWVAQSIKHPTLDHAQFLIVCSSPVLGRPLWNLL